MVFCFMIAYAILMKYEPVNRMVNKPALAGGGLEWTGGTIVYKLPW